MNENKSTDELARELRVRLVREFAAIGLQINILDQQASGLHSNINDFDTNRKIFLQTLLTECSDHLEKGTFTDTAVIINEKYKQYLASAEMKNKKAKEKLEKLQPMTAFLKTAAEDALAQIAEEVLAEKYGRGELFLTKDGPQRIIGRIVDLNESVDPAMGIVLGKSKKFKASVREITWMCENLDRQQPPLFFVDIELMPLNEEELSRICWDNEDYELLTKNIPDDQFVWQSGSIFCIAKSSMYEVYLISRDNENINVVRVEKCGFPNWKIEVLGKVACNKDNLRALCNWGGYNNPPVELEDASLDWGIILSHIDQHLSRKYPGVILEKPQLEN